MVGEELAAATAAVPEREKWGACEESGLQRPSSSSSSRWTWLRRASTRWLGPRSGGGGCATRRLKEASGERDGRVAWGKEEGTEREINVFTDRWVPPLLGIYYWVTVAAPLPNRSNSGIKVPPLSCYWVRDALTSKRALSISQRKKWLLSGPAAPWNQHS